MYGLGAIKWWVYDVFAVHRDTRRHAKGAVFMGKGTIYSTSSKQKLNTKISTESNVVGFDDLMPHILWMQFF